ncbi:MAG: 4Fe-4S dicluster domain-containing protein [Armatimonadetes bacterium]|nr:4Fe-4S dicluster domain-containing protein [Armatimonadota bacterium]
MNEGLVDKLYLLKYEIDEDSHLVIKDPQVCAECEDRVCILRCPAEVYAWEGDHLQVAYENCVECGVCKIVCPYDNIDWRYPRGGYGVFFKLG